METVGVGDGSAQRRVSCAPRGLREQSLPRVLLRSWLLMKPSHCRQASSLGGQAGRRAAGVDGKKPSLWVSTADFSDAAEGVGSWATGRKVWPR